MVSMTDVVLRPGPGAAATEGSTGRGCVKGMASTVFIQGMSTLVTGQMGRAMVAECRRAAMAVVMRVNSSGG
jgi:hypothetical protein